MATRDEVDAALKHSDLYKRSVPVEWKEIKAMVPREYVVKLHSLKVVTGRTVSWMLCEALELYFKEQGGKR